MLGAVKRPCHRLQAGSECLEPIPALRGGDEARAVVEAIDDYGHRRRANLRTEVVHKLADPQWRDAVRGWEFEIIRMVLGKEAKPAAP